ncbi:PQQ-binding-like beta-propeller repeat protein [Demequina sp. SO4-13]|uniref:outer membrane protein assembly factor BamB family protein n=1 Tax=Demequina sp. SO4-13 TaxID=3401027 RepID=UPI003AF72A4C
MSRPARRTLLAAATAAVAALVLAACAPGEPSVEDGSRGSAPLSREPAPGADPPAFDTAGLRLPLQLDGSDFVDPGWEVEPQYLDGIFLAPIETGGHLSFTAVNSEGTALWAAERPLACAGFTLAQRQDGVPLAVLNDSAPTDDAIAQTTATAYDLRTGARVWGPVDVPGPYQGPGLVYASPPPEAMGATGPRVALDSATGEVVVDESDGAARVVAERHGIVVTHDGASVRGTDATGAVAWETELPVGADQAQATPGTALAGTMLLLSTGADRSAVIDLATGEAVATDVTSAAFDEATGLLIATDGDRAWATDAATGDATWEIEASPEARIESAGGAQVYLRDGDSVWVHNSLTGAAMPGYKAELAGAITVPLAIASSGAATLEHEGGVFLATTPTIR